MGEILVLTVTVFKNIQEHSMKFKNIRGYSNGKIKFKNIQDFRRPVRTLIAEQYLKAHGKSFRHWWMSDKHRSEGHETKGLNSENKNRFSNATSKFHGRSGQARVNGQSNPTAGRACWICSSVKHYAQECPQIKTSLIGLCNQVKARSGEMRQCWHAKKLCYSREG